MKRAFALLALLLATAAQAMSGLIDDLKALDEPPRPKVQKKVCLTHG